MPNMNEKNGAVKGRNPMAEALSSFAVTETADAAIWIENGKHEWMKSMPSQVSAGSVTDKSADGVKISSNLERMSAVVVKGKESGYTLSNAVIDISGYGCSDFTARGAGLMAYQGADVVVENSVITTHDAGRSATIATEGSTLKVYNSKLTTHGGALPPNYEPVIGPGMMEPPYPLGLGGNCRTHLSMDNSETYFYNCDVYAGGWAAISTDSSGGYLYFEGNDCRLNVPGNGYGVYSDNGCHVCFNKCDFDVGNMLAIQDGNSSVTLNDCTAVCGGVGFMLHGGMEGYVDTGIIDIKGGKLQSEKEMILAKSTNADIYINGAELISKSGVLLKTMVTDDHFYAEFSAKGPECYGIQMTLEGTELDGDILHEDTERKMNLSLVDTTLKGAITGNPTLMLYGNNAWTATANSEVTLKNIESVDAIDALAGVIITAKAGEGCALAGKYDLKSGGALIVR